LQNEIAEVRVVQAASWRKIFLEPKVFYQRIVATFGGNIGDSVTVFAVAFDGEIIWTVGGDTPAATITGPFLINGCTVFDVLVGNHCTFSKWIVFIFFGFHCHQSFHTISFSSAGSYAPGSGTMGGKPLALRIGFTRSTQIWQMGRRVPPWVMLGTLLG
jgi:hypothetical protein